MKNDLLEFCKNELPSKNFDCLALGIIDFTKKSFESFEISNNTEISKIPYLWFDLASLSKPLNLSAIYHKDEEIFNKEMLLLLEHRGGLFPWGLLGRDDWKSQLESYTIKESSTDYSCFSALRLMLEIEKKSKKSCKELASFYWDKEISYWRDIPLGTISPMSGYRNGDISGEVHDPNAYLITPYSTNAGLFGTINGVCKSLLSLDKETNFVKNVMQEIKKRNPERFVWGWDRVLDSDSLAGKGCSEYSFGHLGFTGTSIWIDPVSRWGWVFFTNATKNYWHEREGLRFMRKTIGEKIWSSLP